MEVNEVEEEYEEEEHHDIHQLPKDRTENSPDRRVVTSPEKLGEEELQEEEERFSTLGGFGYSDYCIQHGAHREYHVPLSLIQHTAVKNMKVNDGHHIGDMVASRSGKAWTGLQWYHVSIIGGQNNSDEKESAPHVCFDPPSVEDSHLPSTDDSHWMRPIPAKVMEYHIPLWKDAIKNKYADKPDKIASVFAKYKRVLEWTADKLNGQRLDPKNFPTGEGGFVPLSAGRKLTSIRIAPETISRNPNTKTDTGPGGSKLKSAISKTHKSKGVSGTSVDMQSDTSDVTTVPDARVVRIGPVATTSTNVFDGILYATLMP